MVTKPLKPCAVPACRSLTKDRYCRDHQEVAKDKERERQRAYDQHKRDKKADAFYKSKEWEPARQQALMRDKGLCRHCLKKKQITLADMVDHIVPIKIAWHLRVHLDNLQSLCNSCHAIKTAEDKRKYGDKV